MKNIQTLGELKKSGYKSRSVKEELRENLISKLKKGEKIFEGILGFDNELNDDPLNPITRSGIETVAEHGDDTPIEWIYRDDRYVEKLATPDVSIADLIMSCQIFKRGYRCRCLISCKKETYRLEDLS